MSGKQTENLPPGLLWAESAMIRKIYSAVSPPGAMRRAVQAMILLLDRFSGASFGAASFGAASFGSPAAQQAFALASSKSR